MIFQTFRGEVYWNVVSARAGEGRTKVLVSSTYRSSFHTGFLPLALHKASRVSATSGPGLEVGAHANTSVSCGRILFGRAARPGRMSCAFPWAGFAQSDLMGCRGSAHLINGRLVSVISEVCFLCVRRGHANGDLSIMFTAKLDPTALPPAGLSCLVGPIWCAMSRLLILIWFRFHHLLDYFH